ncbi:MAG: B12-binding domain-containing radical SAM protein [Promethearchaeota archaeon]
MKILFVEPPKQFWFVMGEYLPPPFGILQLAAYLEIQDQSLDIKVLDCQAERIDWAGLENKITSFQPDVVAPSSLTTNNAFSVLRTIETAKKVNVDITTIVGGQHFTATAQESLETYPEIDIIVRGEGEKTLAEVIQALNRTSSMSSVKGISFRQNNRIVHTSQRPLIENLDDLPFPGYHFVKEHMKRYHFTMMAGAKTPYAIIEGSRGCPHRCTYCSQWGFWGGRHRQKSSKRIADEIEYCYNNFGSRFIWLTDDNFGLGSKTNDLCDELIQRGINDDIMWFMQVRCDDILKHKHLLPKLRKAGNMWILTGLENHNPETLKSFKKNLNPSLAKEAIDLLKQNDILAQAMLIIGERNDSRESIQALREWINYVDPDIAIFTILTPFPGTELYHIAKENNWIEDYNWGNYDMVHAIMSTNHLTRREVQEELFKCYRGFYGSMKRRITGIFSPNIIKRRTYRYLMKQGVLKALRELF